MWGRGFVALSHVSMLFCGCLHRLQRPVQPQRGGGSAREGVRFFRGLLQTQVPRTARQVWTHTKRRCTQTAIQAGRLYRNSTSAVILNTPPPTRTHTQRRRARAVTVFLNSLSHPPTPSLSFFAPFSCFLSITPVPSLTDSPSCCCGYRRCAPSASSASSTCSSSS